MSTRQELLIQSWEVSEGMYQGQFALGLYGTLQLWDSPLTVVAVCPVCCSRPSVAIKCSEPQFSI